jgi:hypothetical protein
MVEDSDAGDHGVGRGFTKRIATGAATFRFEMAFGMDTRSCMIEQKSMQGGTVMIFCS